MNTRLILMVLGTALCIGAAVLGWWNLREPARLLELNMSSFRALFGWAFVLFSALLPIVSAACILWAWLGYLQGDRDRALPRLVAAPAVIAILWGLIFLGLHAMRRGY